MMFCNILCLERFIKKKRLIYLKYPDIDLLPLKWGMSISRNLLVFVLFWTEYLSNYLPLFKTWGLCFTIGYATKVSDPGLVKSHLTLHIFIQNNAQVFTMAAIL